MILDDTEFHDTHETRSQYFDDTGSSKILLEIVKLLVRNAIL